MAPHAKRGLRQAHRWPSSAGGEPQINQPTKRQAAARLQRVHEAAAQRLQQLGGRFAIKRKRRHPEARKTSPIIQRGGGRRRALPMQRLGLSPPWLGPGPAGSASPRCPPSARAASRTGLATPEPQGQANLKEARAGAAARCRWFFAVGRRERGFASEQRGNAKSWLPFYRCPARGFAAREPRNKWRGGFMPQARLARKPKAGTPTSKNRRNASSFLAEGGGCAHAGHVRQDAIALSAGPELRRGGALWVLGLLTPCSRESARDRTTRGSSGRSSQPPRRGRFPIARRRRLSIIPPLLETPATERAGQQVMIVPTSTAPDLDSTRRLYGEG